MIQGRELAFQISEQFAVLGGSLNIRTAVVVGGMDMMTQSIELGNRPHIVIATPGRIVDHLLSSSGEWDLTRVKFLASHVLFLSRLYLDQPDSLGAGRSRQALDTNIYFGTEPSLQCVTKRTTDMPVHRNAYRIHRSFGKCATSARKAETIHSPDESNVSSRLL